MTLPRSIANILNRRIPAAKARKRFTFTIMDGEGIIDGWTEFAVTESIARDQAERHLAGTGCTFV